MLNHKPFVAEIKDVPDILETKHDLIPSIYLAQPRINLGFHTYIHQNKNKMSDSKLRESNFYLVTNKFEHIINDNKANSSDKYFNSKQGKYHKIMNRSFYKMWEMIFYFGLIEDDKNFLSAHIADNPGSFTQATMLFRDKFNKSKNKGDKYCLISYPNDKSKVVLDCFGSDKEPSFVKNHTYSDKNSLIDVTNDSGNMATVKSIEDFKKTVSKNKKFSYSKWRFGI